MSSTVWQVSTMAEALTHAHRDPTRSSEQPGLWTYQKKPEARGLLLCLVHCTEINSKLFGSLLHLHNSLVAGAQFSRLFGIDHGARPSGGRVRQKISGNTRCTGQLGRSAVMRDGATSPCLLGGLRVSRTPSRPSSLSAPAPRCASLAADQSPFGSVVGGACHTRSPWYEHVRMGHDAIHQVTRFSHEVPVYHGHSSRYGPLWDVAVVLFLASATLMKDRALAHTHQTHTTTVYAAYCSCAHALALSRLRLSRWLLFQRSYNDTRPHGIHVHGRKCCRWSAIL